MSDISGKDFLDFTELDRAGAENLIAAAESMKAGRKAPEATQPLAGCSLGLIFFKPSTRTRVSFEVAVYELGGKAVVLSGRDMQLGRGETIGDTARVLSRYLDGIVIRTFAHAEVVELAAESDIPVINALTDAHHPCQALTDMLTVHEKKGTLAGLKMAYVGDGNNVANSLLIACPTVGMDIAVACPAGYEPDAGVLEIARRRAAENGSAVTVTAEPAEACTDVDALYTDVWVSMGDEDSEERQRAFSGFQLDERLAALAKPDHIVMHCLPAHRGEEISAAVADGPNSVIFDQAENRLHAQKALLAALLGH